MILEHRLSQLSEFVDLNSDLNEGITPENFSRRFMYVTRKLNHFWTRWRREYLTDLREAHRMQKRKLCIVEEGDIVLVQEDNVKRNLWKIGVVEKLIKGKDGEIRGAQVRKSGKGKPDILNRPVQKLYPLESCMNNEGKESKNGEETVRDAQGGVSQEHESPGRDRPSRAAAKDARWKSKLMFDPQQANAAQGGG